MFRYFEALRPYVAVLSLFLSFLLAACVISSRSETISADGHVESSDGGAEIFFGTVDRIEGDYAVIETEKGMVDICMSWFEHAPSDGDIVKLDMAVEKAVTHKEATERAHQEARMMLDAMAD
jgi:hypothetical protein